MRIRKGTACSVMLAAALTAVVAGGCALKPSADKEPHTEAAQETVMETETETGAEETEYVEYVSDEDWDAMVHVYRIIMDNYGTAQGLVDSGYADPSGIVEKAGELIEYGKGCERDGLTAEEAGEKLYEMVDTADGMLDLIKQGGGTIVEIPVSEKGTDAVGDAGNADVEDAESVGAATDGAEGAESHDGSDVAGAGTEAANA